MFRVHKWCRPTSVTQDEFYHQFNQLELSYGLNVITYINHTVHEHYPDVTVVVSCKCLCKNIKNILHNNIHWSKNVGLWIWIAINALTLMHVKWQYMFDLNEQTLITLNVKNYHLYVKNISHKFNEQNKFMKN